MRPMGPVGPPGAGGGWRAAIAPLRNPQYRWLFGGNLAFFLAMHSQAVVRAWLAFDLTESELALGSVMFAVALPMFFLAPLGGVMADRFDRRLVILACQVMLVASEFTLWGLLLTDRLEFWHLVVGAGVMGTVFPFSMPARQAIVVNIVGRQGLPRAMALGMAGMNASTVVGPPLAGFLIGAVGVENAYSIGAFLYAVSSLCVLGVGRSKAPHDPDRGSVLESIVDGGRYMLDNRLVLSLLLAGLIPMFLAMPFRNLLVVFAEKVWQTGSEGFGILSAVAGVGGLVGSIWVSFLAGSPSRRRNMIWSMVAFGSLLFGFALSPWFALGLAFAFGANIFSSMYGTLNNTAMQVVIPDHVRGRISAFMMMSMSLPMLGTLPLAAVAEAIGAPIAVAGASVTSVAVALAFFYGSRMLRTLDRRVLEAMAEDAELAPEEPGGGEPGPAGPGEPGEGEPHLTGSGAARELPA